MKILVTGGAGFIGWEPEADFDSWLEKTVAWYKDNESWWKPLKEKSESIYKK